MNPSAIAAGIQLGPYEIVAPLGSGGMGQVYKARDIRLNRTVALKVLSAPKEWPGARERFKREAETIAGLSHPNICALYDVGEHRGTDFLVMEYLEGETLAACLTKGGLPLERAIRYALDRCNPSQTSVACRNRRRADQAALSHHRPVRST